MDLRETGQDTTPAARHDGGMHHLDAIDSHTGGEPTRVILAGFPDLGSGPLAERRRILELEHDDFRAAIASEPRGSDPLVCAILTPPVDPTALTGVLFVNNVGTLGMCGHGMIGLVHTLSSLGRISTGTYRIETAVGVVPVECHGDGSVTVENVESYRFKAALELEVPGAGRITGDVAWGGNWFFITHDVPVPLVRPNLAALTAYAAAIRQALGTAGIRGAGDAEIDHIELQSPSPTPGVDARNFVLCPGMAYDRSPCGTGTSATLACLAEAGRLPPGVVYRQESFVGSVFEAAYRPGTHGIWPRIRGRAHLTAHVHLVIDPADPFAFGIP